MAAAVIKDGETASGPPPRSPHGSPGPLQITLPTAQTGTVGFFFFLKRVLFN